MKTAIIILLILFVSSCGKKDEPLKTQNQEQPGQTQQQTEQIQQLPDTSANDLKVKEPLKMSWVFQKAGTGKNNAPIIYLYLVINEQKIYISTTEYDYQILEEGKNKENDVPEDALTACRGWWAGWGEDYWVLKKGKELHVIKRYIGEPVDVKGNHVPNIGKTETVKKIKIG